MPLNFIGSPPIFCYYYYFIAACKQIPLWKPILNSLSSHVQGYFPDIILLFSSHLNSELYVSEHCISFKFNKDKAKYKCVKTGNITIVLDIVSDPCFFFE